MRAVQQWTYLRRRHVAASRASACTSVGLPPNVAGGAPERPRIVAPVAPTTPSKVRHSPEVPKAVAGRPDRVVVVVLENQHGSGVIGNPMHRT
jgi:hypothetical protein